MKKYASRLINLLIGLFLYALGIVFTLRANIGYAPWDVLHAGLSNIMGISFGLVAILVGLLINVLTVILGEKIGIGTLSNMVLIGVFIDAVLAINVIPSPSNTVIGILMLVGGLFVIALGTYFYMKSAFCSGPRDGLMVALARKTGFPIGLCRGFVELLAVGGGWLLGGMVGIGTVISAIAIGFCVQITFTLLRFDATKVNHETLGDTMLIARRRMQRTKQDE